MKRYTIIYAVTGQTGSHSYSVTSFDRVETTSLKDLLTQDKYRNVWFVFEGWPILEGEFNIPKI